MNTGLLFNLTEFRYYYDESDNIRIHKSGHIMLSMNREATAKEADEAFDKLMEFCKKNNINVSYKIDTEAIFLQGIKIRESHPNDIYSSEEFKQEQQKCQ